MAAAAEASTRVSPAPVDVTCGLILGEGGRVLVARRPPGKKLAGQWEFPGGKVEPGETPAACLARELQEELGVKVQVRDPLPAIVHNYGDHAIRLLPFVCVILDGEPRPHEHTELRWCTVGEIGILELAAADFPVLESFRRLH